MADYWKSLPRKFCDFCKCWITDNKPSVDFHEQGKRHQENVQKKIGELRKKGLKDYEEKKQLDSDFKKMNNAALKAYAKDVERDPTLATELNRELESLAAKKAAQAASQPSRPTAGEKSRRDSPGFVQAPPRSKAKAPIKSWLEAKAEDGTVYYFNSETGESSWEAPAEGYLSLAQQAKSIKVSAEPAYAGIGPSAKPDPYGQWVTVDTSEPEPLDLDLPEQKVDATEYKVVVTPKEEKFKFKEKTVASLADKHDTDSDSVFKKRKFNKDSKVRNMRKKVDDD